jgi:RNA polymerase sigma-70 factor (ECF subfamily)
MTQLTVLPLPTDEPRADALLFPEVHAAAAHVNASGISPISGERAHQLSNEFEETEMPSEPGRNSAMVPRCDDAEEWLKNHTPTPSSSRLVVVQAEAPATSDDRLVAMVRAHSRNVWRALRRLGVPVDLLDDATQEVFIVASRKIDFIEDGAERSFLYGTALRIAANLRRSRQVQRHDQLSDNDTNLWQTEPDQEQLVHRKHLRELLDQILDKMPDDLREVFVLHELEKLTRNELADLLGLPAGTIASRLRRARELFEDACEKIRDFPEGGPR